MERHEAVRLAVGDLVPRAFLGVAGGARCDECAAKVCERWRCGHQEWLQEVIEVLAFVDADQASLETTRAERGLLLLVQAHDEKPAAIRRGDLTDLLVQLPLTTRAAVEPVVLDGALKVLPDQALALLEGWRDVEESLFKAALEQQKHVQLRHQLRLAGATRAAQRDVPRAAFDGVHDHALLASQAQKHVLANGRFVLLRVALTQLVEHAPAKLGLRLALLNRDHTPRR